MADTPRQPEALTIAPTMALDVTASAEQQRAIAEVQVAMVMALRNPRDTIRAVDLIKQDCARPSLAERALYTYVKGGTEITGPSIRLAEAIALRWKNIMYGTRELDREDGRSKMLAFAWDIENNVRVSKDFTVEHVRETKNKGAVALTDSREIYELTANLGARRVRALILELVPGDVVDEAVAQVELTLRTKAEVTPERVTKMLETFAAFGVAKDQIEKRIQRRVAVETLTPVLMLQLGKIANSISDGMSKPGDWFEFSGSGAVAVNTSGALLVSDVLAAGTASGWTVKELMDFVRAKFGKELTALERGAECVAAVQTIVAATAQKSEAATVVASASELPAATPATSELPTVVARPDDAAENAALDRELAAKESQTPASTPGMDAVSKAAADAEASLFGGMPPQPSRGPGRRGR